MNLSLLSSTYKTLPAGEVGTAEQNPRSPDSESRSKEALMLISGLHTQQPELGTRFNKELANANPSTHL